MVAERDIVPRGSLFVRKSGALGWDSRYIILLEDLDFDEILRLKGDFKFRCIEVYLSMEAFGGLPGHEYFEYERSIRYLHSSKARAIPESEVEKMSDDFVRTIARVIKEHGRAWNEKEHFKGTPYWRD